jgi:hypothetical protein
MTDSTWYHVVCFHAPPDPTSYICDIEDDGGRQAGPGYDQLTNWRESSGLPREPRDRGRRLRHYNIGGGDRSPLVRVTVAYDRNRKGHVWQLKCDQCPTNVEASDERLLVALNRLRPHLQTIDQDLTEDQFSETRGIQQVNRRIITYITPLLEVQQKLSKQKLSKQKLSK